ncbi:MAG TPA: hypothetical protein VGJ12_06595 [Gemmatimonadaceae bacterium]|jgi:hypothetical protein
MIDPNEHDDSLDFPAPVSELSAAYPQRASAEWDALAAAIVKRASPELERRRNERGLVRSILRLARPVGAAAAAVLLLGAIGLAVTSDAEATVPAAAPSFAEVVDREPASTLLATDRPPSANDLASVLEDDSFTQVQP